MSEHLVVMDDEYAKLSLFAGWFASAADGYLGADHFISMIRQHAWSLTWAKLAEWKDEAIEMGVPTEELEPTREILALMPQLIEKGKKEQAKVDRKNPGGIVH